MDRKEEKQGKLAILSKSESKLKLIELSGGVNAPRKISENKSHGLVRIDNRVYAVTDREVLQIYTCGDRIIGKIKIESDTCKVLPLQRKIYVVQPHPYPTLCFDPADCSLQDDLPACDLIDGFCAAASDKFVYAVGGKSSSDNKYESVAKKYDHLKQAWASLNAPACVRENACAVYHGSSLLVLGGRDSGEAMKQRSVMLFTDETKWSKAEEKMEAGRTYFSAFVEDDQIFAVGGDLTSLQTHWKDSIEVYNSNSGWKKILDYETPNDDIFSCNWPEDVPLYPPENDKVVHETNKSVGKVLDKTASTTDVISPKGGKMNLPGCEVVFPEGALEKDKEMKISLENPKKNIIGEVDVTPEISCEPPMVFQKPVHVGLESFLVAEKGKEIEVTGYTKRHHDEEWVENSVQNLGQNNQVKLAVNEMSHMKFTAKEPAGTTCRLYNFVYIKKRVPLIFSVFSKFENGHETRIAGDTDLVHVLPEPLEFEWPVGSDIELSLDTSKHPGIEVEITPDFKFRVDESFLRKRGPFVSFLMDPQPENGVIQVKYGVKVGAEDVKYYTIGTEWPIPRPQHVVYNIDNVEMIAAGHVPTEIPGHRPQHATQETQTHTPFSAGETYQKKTKPEGEQDSSSELKCNSEHTNLGTATRGKDGLSEDPIARSAHVADYRSKAMSVGKGNDKRDRPSIFKPSSHFPPQDDDVFKERQQPPKSARSRLPQVQPPVVGQQEIASPREKDGDTDANPAKPEAKDTWTNQTSVTEQPKKIIPSKETRECKKPEKSTRTSETETQSQTTSETKPKVESSETN